MKLQLATWQEVEAYLKTQNSIIIPIGSTEQHGPMGLIGTDAMTAEAIAWGVGEKAQAYVAPTISVGMALHHLDFPGSISLKPSTLIRIICDTLTSLARHGFRKFYFVNGHGGNIATLQAAFSETYWELQTQFNINNVQCRLNNWFIDPSILGLAKELYGNEEGFHATPSEVALTQYLFPNDIKKADLVPLKEMTDHDVFGPHQFRESYPDGRMGANSALASVQDGEKIYNVAVENLLKDYKTFIES